MWRGILIDEHLVSFLSPVIIHLVAVSKLVPKLFLFCTISEKLMPFFVLEIHMNEFMQNDKIAGKRVVLL